MTYLKKLDVILRLLKKTKSQRFDSMTIRSMVADKAHLSIDLDETEILLQELLSKHFIVETQQETEIPGHTFLVYSISVQGLLFIEKGGYTDKVKRKAAKKKGKKWDKIRNVSTSYALLFIALVTVIVNVATYCSPRKEKKSNHIIEIQKHTIILLK